MNPSILSYAAATMYLLASVLLAVRLFRGAEAARTSKRWPLLVAVAALILHSWLVYQGLVDTAGIDLGLFSILSLIAWLVSLLLVSAAFTKPIENLAVLVLPLSALALLLDLWFPLSHVVLEGAPFGLNAHVLLSIFAYSLLSIAAVQAIVLSIQDAHLRRHRPGGFIRALPPLQTMETMLFELIGLGFTLLTLALFSGVMFVEDLFAQHLVHKTVLSIAAWIVFAVLLWGRWRFGWRGRTAIRWTISGFVTLMLAFLGTKLVLELILQR